MRILINSGDYKCSNMGDLAMLQVAVARLTHLFPDAAIQILTANPVVVENHVRPAKALDCAGLQQWSSDRYLLGAFQNVLPLSASKAVISANGGLRRKWPAILKAIVRAKANLSGSTDVSVLEFLRAVYAADLFVVCGQGSITDVFPGSARSVLNFVDLAITTGKPTVLFGQGIGPLTDSSLVQMASTVLPRADLIAVREGKLGPELLNGMNVAAGSIVSTGDDAIEMAFAATPQEIGDAIGVNIRFEDHTAIGTELADRLRPVFKRLRDDHSTTLLPLPISRYPDCKDSRDIEELLSGLANFYNNGRDLDTPMKVIHQTGRCRVVVTAAYHAAVFALSQGIPVVGLAKSQYCLDKFRGLDHQFRNGIQIVMLDSPTLEDDLIQAFERLWTSASTLRPLLLEASRLQIESGNATYGRVAEMLPVRKAAA